MKKAMLGEGSFGTRKSELIALNFARTWLLAIVLALLSLLGMSGPVLAQVINISASPTTFSTEGETITFTYELENLGAFYLTSIDTIDPSNPGFGGPGVTMGACQPFPGGELAPNESVTCTGTYQITAENMLSGQLSHFISMSGQRIGGTWNATSSTFTMQLAGGGPTTTSVQSLTNPSQLGDSTTFQATVSSMGCNAGLAPQGTVTFTVGSESSAPIPVAPSSPISPQGTAEFSTSTLAVGSHAVSAAFTPSGADNCAPSSGTAGSDHVVEDPAPIITGISPTTGTTAGGTSIVITGSNLTGATGVTFGGTAASSFTVDSDTQITAVTPSGSAGTVNVTVTTPDGTDTNVGGFTYQAPAPTVTSVSVPANGYYGAGDSLDFTANFSDPITVNTAGGTPRIALTVGAATRYADYIAGSGSAALVFRYVVNAGDLDVNGIAVGAAIEPNGASIESAGGTSAVLTLNSVGATSGVVIDAVAPTVVSSAASGSPAPDATAVGFEVTFSEQVNGVDASDFTLTTTGSATGTVAGIGTADGVTYYVNVTDIVGVGSLRLDVQANGSIVDAASNAMLAAFTSGTPWARGGSSDATLSGLTPSAGTLAPAFTAATTIYTATVPNATSAITLTPTSTNASATIMVNGTPVLSNNASGPIALDVGINPITVVVTAEDGTTQTYTVQVTREASTNATLSNLMLDTGMLDPGFDPGTASYTVAVGHATDSVTLIPTTADTGATVTVDGQTVASGGASQPVSLSVGTTSIPVVVTAQDGATTQTYTVTVIRSHLNTSTELSADISPTTFGQDVTFTATVTPASPGTPTGTVTFTIDGTIVATETLAGGQASHVAQALAVADHDVVAVYSGDSEHSGSTSPVLVHTVNAPTLTLSPETLSSGTAHVPYDPVTFSADGGAAPYSFTVTSGSLPAGLVLSSEGVLSGTPTETGDFTVTFTATDDHDFSIARQYTLVVDSPTITIAPQTLPTGTGGVVFGPIPLTAEGGAAPYSFAVPTGALPPGLGLDADGMLSGTPTAAGSFTLTITATDSNDFAGEREYTLEIAAPEISVAVPTLLDGSVNAEYQPVRVSASGGTEPYAFDLVSGELPEGMTLRSDGTLAGTPAEAGDFPVTVRATDAYGFEGTTDATLTIDPLNLPVAQNHTLEVMAGTSGSLDLTQGATGGPFTDAAIISLPPSEAGDAHIERDGSAHMLHFAAAGTFAGTASLTYTLSNADGTSDPATVTITIVARPDPTLDPEVIGLIRAQTETATRFANTQITNFNQRLEQLHNETERRNSSLNVGVSVANAYVPPVSEDNPWPENSALSAANEAAGNTEPQAEFASAQVPDFGDLAFWSSGFINFGTREDGVIDLDHTLVGLSAGLDYRFTPEFTAGFGMGYGRDATDVGSNGTESRAEAFSLAAYGSYRPIHGVFIDGLAGYGAMSFDSLRFVTASGEFASGSRSGDQLFASLSAGYEYRQDDLLISPYGRLSGSHSTLNAFTETGAGMWNLAYGEQTIDTLSGSLGLRFAYDISTEWGLLSPRGRIEYTHDFAGSSRASLGYADIGTLPYELDIEGFSSDYVSIGLGFDAQIGDNATLGFDYSTALGTNGDSQDHTFRVQFGVQF